MSPPVIQNITKDSRERAGYRSFKEWYLRKDNLYISRNASKYLGRDVPESKWASPFIVLNRKLGGEKWVQESLQRNYERYIKSDQFLMDSLHELKNQVLGCWCTSPNLCHGSILQKLYIEKYGNNEEEEKMKEKKKEQERKKRRNEEHSEVEETEDEEEYEDDDDRKDVRKEKEFKRKKYDDEREEDEKYEKREKHRKYK